ncbi:MAG TPA: winged helix-turn-helix transcriptional regulator [Nitrosopumilaceae archaeon]|nr:winged helix-turn-helix transcriptional regulator [Nitrosopumilaceae archaeon]
MDKIDMHILSRLLNNCRESDRQIGMEVGISGGAVKSRIKKMQKKGVIEYFTLKIEPPVLGYGVLYFVVTGENLDEIVQQVKLIGEPFFIVPCVGGITVCSIVVKENIQQKIELAKNLMKDVRVLSIFEAENPGVSSNLTKTDLEIINELMKEPRQKIDDIAKKTNLSTKTVTRSIEKLENDDAVQFTLIYEPTKLEGYIPFCILTWINRDLRQTLQSIENEFSENFLQNPFLAKNQIAFFMYSDNVFKMDELTQQIRQVPGVQTADLFIPRKIAFPQEWIKDTIKEAKRSPTLHLMYQTN